MRNVLLSQPRSRPRRPRANRCRRISLEGLEGRELLTAVAAPSGLGSPRGLAFDQDSRLYVADEGTGAIHRYDSQGNYLDDPVQGV